MAKFPWHNLISFYTIKSRITVAFGITIAVLLLVAFVSLSAISILQIHINQFVAGDLSNIQNVKKLSYIVPNIVSVTTQLFEVNRKESLQRIYNTIDEQLLTLEKTTHELSHQEHSTASQLLDILFLSQQIRSEAQLSVQLLSAALDTEREFQTIHNQIYQAIALIHGEIYQNLSHLQIVTSRQKLRQLATLNNDLQIFFDFIEKFEYRHQPFPTTAQQKKDIEKALVNIKSFIKNLEQDSPDSHPEKPYQYLEQFDINTLVNLKNTENQYRKTSNTIYINLQQTVNSLDNIGQEYVKIMSADFERQTRFITTLKIWLQSVLVMMVMLALGIVSWIQLRLISRGFSYRLEVIRQFLVRIPTTTQDTLVPVKGNDEIALMARSLERLLTNALRINSLATIDDLTGISNRRHFFERVKVETERAKRQQQVKGAAVFILDIDFFKKVNDTYGHHIGDEVLIKFAIACQHCLRMTDILARLGGEEFIIYCPDINFQEAQTLGERIRQQIADLTFEITQEIGLKITVSIGVAIADPFDSNIAQAMKRADNALYAAKKQGRNRVVISSEFTDQASFNLN